MSGARIFISDLHLAEQRPATVELFSTFLTERPVAGDQLYILGDLFDAWVGDDDDNPLAQRVQRELRDLTERGVQLFVQRGNRDFLIGKGFARATGALILPDPYRITIAGRPTLLMHGDLLCTDDHAYMKARRYLRNPLTQWLFLRKSLPARREVAAEYRRRSGDSKSITAMDIMDANTQTIVRYLRKYRATQLIHGHTHRPAIHRHRLPDDSHALRFVLSEWHDDHAAALVEDGGRLQVFSVPQWQAIDYRIQTE